MTDLERPPREIPLTRGFVAFVDDEDYERIARFKWYARINRRGIAYATRCVKNPNGGRPRQLQVHMHREIIGGVEKHLLVDHIDGNGLNNRRRNLRTCTPTENARNSRRPPSRLIGFRGIYQPRRSRGWSARIQVDLRQIHLGTFETKEAAASAYDAAAIRYFREFAVSNTTLGLLFPRSVS